MCMCIYLLLIFIPEINVLTLQILAEGTRRYELLWNAAVKRIKESLLAKFMRYNTIYAAAILA